MGRDVVPAKQRKSVVAVRFPSGRSYYHAAREVRPGVWEYREADRLHDPVPEPMS